jgi:hypothetical protein
MTTETTRRLRAAVLRPGDVVLVRDGFISQPTKDGLARLQVFGYSDGYYRWEPDAPCPFARIPDLPTQAGHVAARRLLAAVEVVASCVSRDPTRPNLHGVMLMAGSVIATNGHIIGMADDTGAPEGLAFSLPPVPLMRALKRPAKEVLRVDITTEGQIVTVDGCDLFPVPSMPMSLAEQARKFTKPTPEHVGFEVDTTRFRPPQDRLGVYLRDEDGELIITDDRSSAIARVDSHYIDVAFGKAQRAVVRIVPGVVSSMVIVEREDVVFAIAQMRY